MVSKQWWKEAFSDNNNASTTRIGFLSAIWFIIIFVPIVVFTGYFTADLGWLLGSIFTSACGLKGGQKFAEYRHKISSTPSTVVKPPMDLMK